VAAGGAAVMLELCNVIGGVDRSSPAPRRPIVDPTSGEAYASAPDSGPDEVDAAFAAAAAALPAWRRASPAERSRRLFAAADVLERHTDVLARAEVADTGKPWPATRDDEIPSSIDHLRFFAGAARLLDASACAEYIDGVTSAIRREPVGVCAQITPWNYPFMMALWKWAPALAAGNTVVLKPSELTPASTVLSAGLLADTLPSGVLNVVCGGAETGALLARHRGADMVALTGSVRAGQAVAAAAAGRLIRVHLELGGNAPVLVFDDADVAATAAAVAVGAFYNAGQDCTAASRVLVEASVHDALVEALVAEAAAARSGDPFTDGVVFGPLISDRQLERVQGLLARRPARATVVCGGRRLERPGFFHEATVVIGLAQEDELVQEEIFGPVVTVQRFGSEAEAVAMANGVEQGLTASVWTTDHARAHRLCRDLDFGSVSVNVHAPMAAEVPHGGFGRSGYGKDLSAYGLADYTRIKHVAHALD